MCFLINFLPSTLCSSHQVALLFLPSSRLFCAFPFNLTFPLIICPFHSCLAVFVECMKQNILMDVWTAWDVSAWELPPCDRELWQGIETTKRGKEGTYFCLFLCVCLFFLSLSPAHFSVYFLSLFLSAHTLRTKAQPVFWLADVEDPFCGPLSFFVFFISVLLSTAVLSLGYFQWITANVGS